MRNLTIEARVRPGRMAVLIDANDGHWQGSCLRIIEYFTRLWGGCGNIIVPTDGKSISPLFWKILERFDPDYLYAYARTGADIEAEEPAKFQQQYQRHIEGWEQQIGGKPHPEAEKDIRERLREVRISPLAISAQLQEELRDRLSPFFFQQWIVEPGSVTADSSPHYPQTNIVDVLPETEHPPRVLCVSDAAPFGPLWWASCFGRANSELLNQLAKLNVGTLEQGATDDEVKILIGLAVKGYEGIEAAPFFANTTLSTLTEILQSAPIRLSMAGLGYYRPIRHQDSTDLVIAVAGNTLEDFAFYFALSRAGGPLKPALGLSGIDHEWQCAT